MPDKEARSGAPANPPVSMPDRTTLIAFAAFVILVTDETISLLFLVGAAVVLAGVYVGALMADKKVDETPPEPEEAEEDILARPGLPTCV